MNKFTPWNFLLISLVAVFAGSHFLFEHPALDFFNRLLALSQDRQVIAGLIVLGLTADILLPVPSSVISVWAVVALGITGGFAAIWVGLCLGCVFGYWLGAGSGTWLLKKFVKTRDIIEAGRMSSRYGTLALVLLRAVPVLAEASVITAGLVKMPFRRFLFVTSLSNAGIALVYAGLGKYMNIHTSFIAALAASMAVPAAAWGLALCFKRLRRPGPVQATGADEIRPAFNIDFSYPVCFTRRVFAPQNPTLADMLTRRQGAGQAPVRVFFIVDGGVSAANPDLKRAVGDYCRAHNLDWNGDLLELPGGEAAKTQENIGIMHRRMLADRLDRQSYVVAIGGGAVLDAAGYAAATFHRGVRLIRMPTTVLAQNDAGIGVKNGINSEGIKNLLGCFTVPYAVINDRQFLMTLPKRDFRAGFAEAVKVALIRDAGFFHWMCANAELLNQRDEQATEYLIKRCAELHLNQICHGGDPFETGNARPLDYGHWSAHKLESLSNHQLSHGEAVAIGMALDTLYAVEAGLLERGKAERIIGLLRQFDFDLWHSSLLSETADGGNALLAGLEEFRQHLGGRLCITLLTDIGQTVEVNTVDIDLMLAARNKLHDCAGRRSRQYLPGELDEIGSSA